MSQVQLAKDCLVYAADEIASQLSQISKAADNTKEKKRMQSFERKETDRENRQMEAQRLMTSKPRSTFLSSLRQAKKALARKHSGWNQSSESGSTKTDVEGEQLSSVLQPRKRKKTANTADPDPGK